MSPAYEPADLLSIAQAAKALDVSIWTVYRRAKNNLVDSVEIAGRTYIPKSEVERLKEIKSRRAPFREALCQRRRMNMELQE
jgi:predicted site-specific integrase-resolvase